MNIFERIQHERGLENYCTDILVGILGKSENVNLLRSFCLEVLEIPLDGILVYESLEILLQKRSINSEENPKANQLDIKIVGTDFLCYFEVKVESPQGKERDGKSQLRQYHDDLILNKEKKNKYLRFCTKYKEKVLDDDIEVFKVFGDNVKNAFYFKDLRWYKVHEFLKKERKENDSLIKEFLDFLELKNMSYLIGSITYDKNFTFEFFEMLSNFSKILERVKQEKAEFDYINIIGTPQLRLDDHKRYGFSIPLEEGTKNRFPYSTNVFIGFDFGERNKVFQLIWAWSKDYDKSTLVNWKFKDETQDREYGNKVAGLRVQKELKKDTQLQEIYDWFISELQNIKTN